MGKLLDLEGKRFGSLVVLSKAGINHYRARLWWCLCDCGKRSTHVGYQIKAGHVNSCGCQKGRHGCDPESPYRHVFADYKYSATKRNLKFELSYSFFRKLIAQECHYCGLAPQPRHRKGGMIANSLDRKNPSVGYTRDNVVPACIECNMAKSDRTYRQFEMWIERLIARRLK